MNSSYSSLHYMLLFGIRDPYSLTPQHVCTICVLLLATLQGSVLDTYRVPLGVLHLTLLPLSLLGVAIVDYLRMFKLDAL